VTGHPSLAVQKMTETHPEITHGEDFTEAGGRRYAGVTAAPARRRPHPTSKGAAFAVRNDLVGPASRA
jgi:hypothetical protein